ncbi:hypothetical protein Tco_1250123 [Tanacetum coccineum]
MTETRTRNERTSCSAQYFEGPFEVVERVDPVAYRLRLPQELVGIHDTFHMSNLKKCLADTNLHVPLEEIKIDNELHFVEDGNKFHGPRGQELKPSTIHRESSLETLEEDQME